MPVQFAIALPPLFIAAFEYHSGERIHSQEAREKWLKPDLREDRTRA